MELYIEMFGWASLFILETISLQPLTHIQSSGEDRISPSTIYQHLSLECSRLDAIIISLAFENVPETLGYFGWSILIKHSPLVMGKTVKHASSHLLFFPFHQMTDFAKPT